MRDIFRVIIAGSRFFNDYAFLKDTMDRSLRSVQYSRIVVLSGGAEGADALGERYADHYGYPVIRVLPEWDTYGKAAGPIRNGKMALIADAAVCFVPRDGATKGTASMIKAAETEELMLRIIPFDAGGKEE